ncbi:hypothetical protein [Tardiphaga sp.]|jgi:hypothetical protein|uniref:hypothetical protein n=1 Tax=Tardiphaga sp. TaxID=1926292 RepID=UPI0037D9F589
MADDCVRQTLRRVATPRLGEGKNAYFFFIIFVNTKFTTLVTPRFTAFLERSARMQAPLACGVPASSINRAATLIAY